VVLALEGFCFDVFDAAFLDCFTVFFIDVSIGVISFGGLFHYDFLQHGSQGRETLLQMRDSIARIASRMQLIEFKQSFTQLGDM